jgi:hypothetical protein
LIDVARTRINTSRGPGFGSGLSALRRPARLVLPFATS